MTSQPQKIMMTTEGQGGFDNAECLGILTAKCVFGPRVLNDVFATVQPVVEKRSQAIEGMLKDGDAIVLDQLRDQAAAQDADAVVAVSIRYTPIGSGGSNRVLISAAGTAVRFVG